MSPETPSLPLAATATLVLALLAGPVHADICGCQDLPSLGAFNSEDPGTYPPNTQVSGSTITLELPADGILIFDSFNVGSGTSFRWVQFAPNAANTPVQLRVKGDLNVAYNATLDVRGRVGAFGSLGLNGVGGAAGPGGFRGGDGAYQLVNFAADGGTGLGPAGGLGGNAATGAAAQRGYFVGTADLLTLIGGGGGGGGFSSAGDLGCSGGGGGGGGGALFIAANGVVSVRGTITADGATGGGLYSSSCSSRGAGGAGGALRIVADRIVGDGYLYARGSDADNDGRIRLEAFEINIAGHQTDPVASRVQAPGPLVNPVSASIAITAVNGETVSLESGQPIAVLPQGAFGLVDVLIAAPGSVDVELATSGVPANTLVDVTLKASPNGRSEYAAVALDPGDCDIAGDCTALLTLPDVQAGRYVLEAEATFQTP